VVGVARSLGEDRVIAIAPRLPVALAGSGAWAPVGREVWGDTTLALPTAWPAGPFRNAITRETITAEAGSPARIRLADALGSCPVALLVAHHGEGAR
jgi:maltooligosyltrehalose synthase